MEDNHIFDTEALRERMRQLEEIEEEAIDFAKYVNVIAVRNGADEWTTGSGANTKRSTSKELFNQFLQEKYSKP